MRFALTVFAFVTNLLMASFPAGADEPFGADTLGYLTNGSNLIVRIKGLKSQPTIKEARYSLYSGKGVQVLKGNRDLDQDIVVAVPLHDVEQPRESAPADAVAFLRKFDPEEDDPGNLPQQQDIYIAVAGTRGIVDAAVPARLDAIYDFVRIDGGKDAVAPVVDWAMRHVESEDPFLQRSAVVALYQHADAAKARKAIASALAREPVSAENKLLLVEALGQTGAESAIPALRRVVEDARSPRALREAAARWFRTLPGGPAQLEKWRRSADAELASIAEAVLSGG